MTRIRPRRKVREKGVRETTVVTVPDNGGISTGDVVLLVVGGSALVVGALLFTRRET
jgi:hypothetical protein